MIGHRGTTLGAERKCRCRGLRAESRKRKRYLPHIYVWLTKKGNIYFVRNRLLLWLLARARVLAGPGWLSFPEWLGRMLADLEREVYSSHVRLEVILSHMIIFRYNILSKIFLFISEQFLSLDIS